MSCVKKYGRREEGAVPSGAHLSLLPPALLRPKVAHNGVPHEIAAVQNTYGGPRFRGTGKADDADTLLLHFRPLVAAYLLTMRPELLPTHASGQVAYPNGLARVAH